MTNLVQGTNNNATLCVNGEMTYPKNFDMLPVTVCDKKGKQLFDAKLGNLAYVPDTPFN
jgi:hypothetical protein